MDDPRRHWALDFSVHHLNHGSFGAVPRPVLDAQSQLRERMERNPMQFLMRDWEALHDEARAALGRFLGAHPDDLAAVPNATAAVNAVLRSLDFGPGDELLLTDHEYNACANALRYVAERSGASVVTARVPFPLGDPGEVVAAVLAAVTPRTRLALLDHVTSQSGLVFPIERLVGELRARGVEALVDGAHGPGMVPLDLDALGAAFYTGNLHKWVCAPRGAAFLHVRRDVQPAVRPLAISHGANSPRTDRSRFRIEWDWTGTDDPTAFLAAPVAVGFLGSLLPGGWGELRARNRDLALRARAMLCDALGVPAPAPESMIGSLATVPVPDRVQAPAGDAPPLVDPLQWWLFERHRIEAPVMPWTSRVLRVSAQIYNRPEEYELLAGALRELAR